MTFVPIIKLHHDCQCIRWSSGCRYYVATVPSLQAFCGIKIVVGHLHVIMVLELTPARAIGLFLRQKHIRCMPWDSSALSMVMMVMVMRMVEMRRVPFWNGGSPQIFLRPLLSMTQQAPGKEQEEAQLQGKDGGPREATECAHLSFPCELFS
eukprot:CAMPEP_0178438000 /NCGR_PEP_ID=MMETSP0689_2-20121128/35318_1 /TAXON_ID=160604 /ORGANISM="Amphidinium massartii, Strain CS-259" /LENGTH=151 /DNA_ID=CAMNT_0020060291 /DNA_START=1900 /DNA_END=2352 /DNA_ORIENTATION=+